MLGEVLFGAGFAFAATIQPGPLLAFLFARVAERGWRHTLPAACAPLISDGPIALVAVAVVGRLPDAAQRGLQVTGGILLLALAWMVLARWRHPSHRSGDDAGTPPRTLLQAVAVNAANPAPYLSWALVLGPAVLRAWHAGAPRAVALVAAFYGTMLVTLSALIVAFGTVGRLSPRGRRILVLASALALAALGVVQLVRGASPWLSRDGA